MKCPRFSGQKHSHRSGIRHSGECPSSALKADKLTCQAHCPDQISPKPHHYFCHSPACPVNLGMKTTMNISFQACCAAYAHLFNGLDLPDDFRIEITAPSVLSFKHNYDLHWQFDTSTFNWWGLNAPAIAAHMRLIINPCVQINLPDPDFTVRTDFYDLFQGSRSWQPIYRYLLANKDDQQSPRFRQTMIERPMHLLLLALILGDIKTLHEKKAA